MKIIIVKWVPDFGINTMKVIKSSHPRFSNGTRFDFGFFKIAIEEGYTIISLPEEV